MKKRAPSAPSGRSRQLIGAAAVAAVFLLKVVVLFQLKDQPLLQPDAGMDTTAYAKLAEQVVGGNLTLGPGVYYVSPLYIYVLAAGLAVFHSFTAVRVIQIVLGTVSVAGIFLTTRRWFGERAAWIAAALAALTGLFTFYEVLILQASIDACLTSIALLALTYGLSPAATVTSGTATAPKAASAAGTPPRPAEGRPAAAKARSPRDQPPPGLRRSAGPASAEAAGGPPKPFAKAEASTKADGLRYVPLFLAGLAFGIQTLNRPNVLLAAAGVALVMAVLLRRVRPSVILVAGLIAGMSPAAIRNAVVSHQWSFVSSHGGLNFYIGNRDVATGFYYPVPGITPTIAGQEKDAQRVAARALGHPVTDSEASDYFFGLSWAWIREHPADASALFVKKLRYVFNAQHIALPQSYPFYAYDLRTALRFYFVGPWLLIPLGLTGLIAAAPERRRTEYLVWASFVPAYAAAVAVFFVAERYRLPMLVPLAVGAGGGIDAVARRIAAGKAVSLAVPGLLFAVLMTGANWPAGLDNGRWQEGLRTAQQLVILGRYDEANTWAEWLDTHRPAYPGAGRYGVGAQLLEQHQVDRALLYLTAAVQANPGKADIEYALGRALLEAGRAREAIPHLQRGFDAGIELPNGGYDLAAALQAVGDFPAAVAALKRINLADPDDAEALLRLGRLAAQSRAPEVAEPFFARAAALRPDQASARQQYGLDLLVLGRFDDAARELDAAVRLDPHDPDSLSHLSYCEIKLGRLDDARTHARAALAINPADALAAQLVKALG